jgi:hypothetical protein
MLYSVVKNGDICAVRLNWKQAQAYVNRYGGTIVKFAVAAKPKETHTICYEPKYTYIPEQEIVICEWEARTKTPEEQQRALEQAKQKRKQYIAAKRYETETGGLILPDGTVIRTDRESRGLLTGAAFAATLDPETPIKWKAANGWVIFTPQQMLEVADMVRKHVQACFDKEGELTEKIMAATSIEELEAIKWE